MQITSKFTIAIHALCAISYFKEDCLVTAGFLAGGIGVNPVIIRNIIGDLKSAGMVRVSHGKRGIRPSLAKKAIFTGIRLAVEIPFVLKTIERRIGNKKEQQPFYSGNPLR